MTMADYIGSIVKPHGNQIIVTKVASSPTAVLTHVNAGALNWIGFHLAQNFAGYRGSFTFA